MRTGIGNAYPHTNQFHHNQIQKGDAFQVVCIPRIGGYNGEQYRSFQIVPWDDHRERVWDVHTESCMIQARESKAGVRCQDVARAVHAYQVENGMAAYIYHRPAHRQGIEGHQPPYIALGDDTVLEAGMTFSNEPGLYDPGERVRLQPQRQRVGHRDKGCPDGLGAVHERVLLPKPLR